MRVSLEGSDRVSLKGSDKVPLKGSTRVLGKGFRVLGFQGLGFKAFRV